MKELGREFLLEAKKELEFVTDLEIVSMVNSVGKELVAAAGSDPDYYNFFVIRENRINAFAVPGGYIFVYDGLIKNLNSIEGLAGVLAHEIAHVERNHHFKDARKVALADIATIAGIILGGLAGGSQPEASIAIAEASNISYKLKLSREHEEDADLFALRYLRKSRYHPSGLSDFFKKLSHQERLYSTDVIPTYLSTHPGVIERQVIVEALIKDLPAPEKAVKRGKWDWEKIRTMIKGVYNDGFDMQGTYDQRPDDRKYFLKGIYAFSANDYKRAIENLEKAIEINPYDAQYYAHLSSVYMQAQKKEKAREVALKCISLSRSYSAPFIVLGIDAKESSQHLSAEEYLTEALKLSPNNSFVYYHLAGVYHDLGRPDLSRYNLAEYYRLNIDPENAVRQLMMALEEPHGDEFGAMVRKKIDRLRREGM
ncbi:MAG: M48 family metalloprotease [Deltaproteobacteria bacterium]|nr:M48 family metalloprotease [Deltaproteobacteria bacterium]